MLETQVLSLSQVVRDNSAEFIKHVHGSHVVRTLLHVMAGCVGPPRTETRPGTHTHTHTQKHSTESTSVYPNDYENILPFVSKIMFKNELIKLKQIFCPFHFLYWSYFSSYMTNYAPHFNCALSSVN